MLHWRVESAVRCFGLVTGFPERRLELLFSSSKQTEALCAVPFSRCAAGRLAESART